MPDDLLEVPSAVPGGVTKSHNEPPIVLPPAVGREGYEAFLPRTRDFSDAAGAWLDLKAIRDEEQASKLSDFIRGAQGLWKEIDGERETQKKPHLQAGKAIDAAFTVLKRPVELAIEKAKALQTDWLKAEQRRLDAERAEARRIAKEEADAAEAARVAAEERNDVMGIADAEQAAARASEAQELVARDARAKVTSATGGGRATGLRTRRVARITNWTAALMYCAKHPNVREAVQSTINAYVRSAEYGANPRPIPGATIEEEQYT